MRRLTFFFTMIGIVCVFMISLFHSNTLWASPTRGGTLIWARSSRANNLDPAVGVSAESQTAIIAIHETLVRYSDDFNRLEPGLAVAWTISDDGKIFDFCLREDVLFHDKTIFNAEAVRFSFLRQMDSRHPYSPEKIGYARYIFDMVRQISVISSSRVRIELKKPYAPFLHSLTMSSACIVSPSAVKKWGNDYTHHPSGTGPFKLEFWEGPERISLVRNEDYWGDKPYLDRLVYKTVVNNQDRLTQLVTSAVHVMDGIGPEEYDLVLRDKHLDIVQTPGLNTCFIILNTQKAPFDNVKVRQAVNYAVNKDKIVKLLYQDQGEAAINPFPQSIWGYNHDISGYPFDPDKARAMLKEAGYPNGLKVTLCKLPVPRFYNKLPDQIASLIQANLKTAGINAEIATQEDWEAYRSMLQQGKHQMAFYGWGAEYKDPDFFLYNLFDSDNAVIGKGYNFSFFKDNNFHELIMAAQRIPDQVQRARLYKKAQEIVHEQAPWIPLVHSAQLLAVNKKRSRYDCRPAGIL